MGSDLKGSLRSCLCSRQRVMIPVPVHPYLTCVQSVLRVPTDGYIGSRGTLPVGPESSLSIRDSVDDPLSSQDTFRGKAKDNPVLTIGETMTLVSNRSPRVLLRGGVYRYPVAIDPIIPSHSISRLRYFVPIIFKLSLSLNSSLHWSFLFILWPGWSHGVVSVFFTRGLLTAFVEHNLIRFR